MTTGSKYTVEILAPLVRDSTSFHGVLRALGLKLTGGSQAYIKRLVTSYGLDTSHFLGQGHRKGTAGPDRLGPEQVLVVNRLNGLRENAGRLRRVMFDAGFKEECAECGLGPKWNGRPLRLQVDHKNGDFTDNRRENVRFLCPNCHAQTPCFGVANAYWK